MKIEEVCTMVFLAVNTGMDFRKKEISLYLTGIYGCAGVVFSVLSQRELWDMLLPLAIGLLFLLFSFGAVREYRAGRKRRRRADKSLRPVSCVDGC